MHFLPLLLLISLPSILQSATIGKPVKVPDNDPTLQSLISRSVLQQTNNELRDTVWWVPVPGSSLQATKTSVPNGGKLYTTYDFTLTSAKSTCKKNAVSYSQISRCSVDPKYSDRQLCKVTLAWTEKDYSTVEMETYCTRNAQNTASKP
ncbi:hypothetical protein PRIPAC_91146 [Pristionchus pacificus]|uniref:Uncharacterized protein n=1 Tax=Pristionchus pacificus TaxID=54126 RepID=A0A2A6CY39_PRIPA|nr:hypothetical protein PRIPAC_91146 [Pristionchus pacificus]|eukprot:PDM83048.1 hypothetical protein PRIPAC_37441 [Pristionchus pacificus]